MQRDASVYPLPKEVSMVGEAGASVSMSRMQSL